MYPHHHLKTFATDAAIQKKTLQSGTTLIISNEEMEDMTIVSSLKKSGLLIKGVIETIKKKQKKKKLDF